MPRTDQTVKWDYKGTQKFVICHVYQNFLYQYSKLLIILNAVLICLDMKLFEASPCNHANCHPKAESNVPLSPRRPWAGKVVVIKRRCYQRWTTTMLDLFLRQVLMRRFCCCPNTHKHNYSLLHPSTKITSLKRFEVFCDCRVCGMASTSPSTTHTSAIFCTFTEQSRPVLASELCNDA